MGMAISQHRVGRISNKIPFRQSLKHIWGIIHTNVHLMSFKISLLEDDVCIETSDPPPSPPPRFPLGIWTFHYVPFLHFIQSHCKGKAPWKYLLASCGWLVYTQITKSDYKFVNVFACRERPVLLMVIKLNYPVHFYSKRKTDPCSLVSPHNVDV